MLDLKILFCEVKFNEEGCMVVHTECRFQVKAQVSYVDFILNILHSSPRITFMLFYIFQALTFITDIQSRNSMPNSHPLSLPSFQHLCFVVAQISGSQNLPIKLPVSSAPSLLSRIHSHQPPLVVPSLPILVNQLPNQKAPFAAASFPWSTCQRESDREGKSGSIVPQHLMGLFCGSVFNNSPGTMARWPLGASTGWSLTRVEARSVLACGVRAGMWDWWMMGVKETRRVGWQEGLLKSGCSMGAVRLRPALWLSLSNSICCQCQTKRPLTDVFLNIMTR